MIILTYTVPKRSEVLCLETRVSPGGGEDKAGSELCGPVVGTCLAPVYTVVTDLISTNLEINISMIRSQLTGQSINKNLALLVKLLSTLGVNHCSS